jgi:enoyl-CoA hydratase/carnithine racemase
LSNRGGVLLKVTEYQTLFTEEKGAVTFISLNTPEKLNILTSQVFLELNEVLDDIEKNDNVKVVVITGMGDKAFVAGADITVLAQLDTVQAHEHMVSGHKLFLRIHEYSKPIIAMVNGYALGGGFELALSCDVIIASENARFGFPEINLNTMPGWGGTQLAVKKMGLNRAKEMILSGKYYPALDCRDFGFINLITSAEELYSKTMEMAETIALKNPISLKMAKDAVNRGAELDMANGFRYEAQAYTVNFSAPHAKEGFNAFFNRRK